MDIQNKIRKIFVITLVISMIATTITVAAQASNFLELRESSTDEDRDICIKKLSVYAPSSVYEGESFAVFVTADGMPLQDVLIAFLNGSYYTGSNGTAVLTAPMVEHTWNYSITASKPGYMADITWICVLNDERPQLVIYAPAFVNEGEVFQVIVTAENQSLDNVQVIFRNKTYITNMSMVYIKAPQVKQDITEPIFAFKEGYLPDVSSIVIRDTNTTYGHLRKGN